MRDSQKSKEIKMGQTLICNATGRKIIVDGVRSRDGAVWEMVRGNHESTNGTARFFGTNYKLVMENV